MFSKRKMVICLCLSYLLANGWNWHGALEMGVGTVAEAQDSSSGERVMPAYWINRSRDTDRVLLDPQQVWHVNQEILHQSASLTFLAEYPEKIHADAIRNNMRMAMKAYSGWELPRLFKEGRQLTWGEWKDVKDNCGFDIPMGEQAVLYGVTTRRTNIRLLPTAEHWYAEDKGPSPDRMQGAVLDPAEAVAVLAKSVDGKFFFVQGRNAMGWADAGSIGLTSRTAWMDYVVPREYLVVTANQRSMVLDSTPLLFQMGARIPVVARESNFVTVLLPTLERSALVSRRIRIALDDTLHLGPLPYNRANIIRQAFRCLGEPYDWDGTMNTVTDTSFVVSVYRSVGIELPGDIAEQERVMLTTTSMKGMAGNERYAMFFDVQPGTLLFQPDHVMLYLGRDGEGEPTVIHAGDEGVTVSDLYDEEEKTNRMDLLTSIGSIR